MKLRLIGQENDFNALDIESLDRNKFETFRKPQAGRNPKYEKDNNQLMYVEVSLETLKKMLKPLRKQQS